MTKKKCEVIINAKKSLDYDGLYIEDVCSLLNCSPSTINNYINDGLFPAPKKIFKRNVWREKVVLDWIDKFFRS